jgi:hypothetical protein
MPEERARTAFFACLAFVFYRAEKSTTIPHYGKNH